MNNLSLDSIKIHKTAFLNFQLAFCIVIWIINTVNVDSINDCKIHCWCPC